MQLLFIHAFKINVPQAVGVKLNHYTKARIHWAFNLNNKYVFQNFTIANSLCDLSKIPRAPSRHLPRPGVDPFDISSGIHYTPGMGNCDGGGAITKNRTYQGLQRLLGLRTHYHIPTL